jgi:hypothetical protein
MGLAVIALALLFLQVGNPIVTPPQNNTTTIRNEITVLAPEPDPQAIAEASVESAQAIVVQLIAPTLVGWANDAINMANIFTTTPPEWTYRNDVVRSLAISIASLALSLMALFVIGAAFGHMLGQGASYGRLAYGAVMSGLNLMWWEIGISLNNAICAVIAAPGLGEIVRPHLTLPSLTTNPIEAFGPSVLVIVYAGVALLLVFSLIFRLALIDILIVVGSLALVTKSAEQTDSWASRYTSLAAGTLFSQIAIVICLRLAPVLGGIGTGFVGTILGIAVLLLARKMPSMFGASHHSGGGGGIGKFLILRRLLFRA